MAYDASTGRITVTSPYGVDITDAMEATGCGVASVGYIIANGGINVWSKYKPVQYTNSTYGNHNTARQWNYSANRWKTPAEISAADINDTPWWYGLSTAKFGITPKKFTTGYASQIKAAYDGDMNGWTYSRPLGNAGGGVQFPLRLQDFAMYNAKAIPPVSHFTVPDTITVGQGNYVKASAIVDYDGNYDSITLADLGITETLYFGVIFELNDTLVLMVTEETAGSGMVWRQFPSAGMLQVGQTYNVYPVLSNVSKFSSSILTNAGEYLYTCPGCEVLTTTAISHDQAVKVEMEIQPILSQANRYTFRVLNETTTNFTLLEYVITEATTAPTTGWTNWPTNRTVNANSASAILTATVENPTTHASLPNAYIYIRFYWAGGGANSQYTRSFQISPYTPLDPTR